MFNLHTNCPRWPNRNWVHRTKLTPLLALTNQPIRTNEEPKVFDTIQNGLQNQTQIHSYNCMVFAPDINYECGPLLVRLVLNVVLFCFTVNTNNYFIFYGTLPLLGVKVFRRCALFLAS